MNLLVMLLFLLLGVPFIPAVLEYVVREDKGPRDVQERTTREDELKRDTPRLERARQKARAKVAGEVIRIVGDASIPDGTEVGKHLIVHGDLKLGRRCHVYGTVKAFGNVEIGEDSIVEGHILSEGKIRIGRRSVVKGVVDSTEEIVIEENAVAEAVSSDKTVTLQLGAKINKRIQRDRVIKDLLPEKTPGRGDFRIATPEAAKKHPMRQPRSDEADYREESRRPSKKLRESLTEEEIFERLLASKMREAVRRKIEVRRPPSGEQGSDEGEIAWKVSFLPVLMLSALLVAEMAYYGPTSVVPLETLLPISPGSWTVLLTVFIGLGLATIFYTIRHLSQHKLKVKTSKAESKVDERRH